MMYVKDLPTDVDVNLYADDAELYYCHSDFSGNWSAFYSVLSHMVGCQQVETEYSEVLIYANWNPSAYFWQKLKPITWQCSNKTVFYYTIFRS